MGKRYHCDYCDKTIVASPSTIKTHNKGSAHQRIVNDHYQQYKDPETILEEESSKRPCIRYSSGQCPFGSICRYSHYTHEEINYLRSYVAQKKQRNSENPESPESRLGDLYEKFIADHSIRVATSENTSVLYESNGFTHVLPWSYNPIFDSYGENLPPSLKRFKAEDFMNADITNWG